MAFHFNLNSFGLALIPTIFTIFLQFFSMAIRSRCGHHLNKARKCLQRRNIGDDIDCAWTPNEDKVLCKAWLYVLGNKEESIID